jgi:hypothetical protein
MDGPKNFALIFGRDAIAEGRKPFVQPPPKANKIGDRRLTRDRAEWRRA